MGEASHYVPVVLTKVFRDAQTDEKFQGWLKMQEASMGIEFPIYDLPEICDSMYTKDSLPIVEQKLLDLYQDSRVAFIGEDNLHRTMRLVYYIGETYRRCFEGIWVAIPTNGSDGEGGGTQPGIQLPFRESFITPAQQLKVALIKRTGTHISRVYGHAERDYSQWIEDDRPEVQYIGTLRESNG